MNDKKKRIYFRADGNSQIGLGHVFRLLALADMLRNTFDCFFLIQHPSEAISKHIYSICGTCIEIPLTKNFEEEAAFIVMQYASPKDIFVLDGYCFDTAYQQIIRKKGCLLVCIDDIHAYPFVADIVINPAARLDADLYTLQPYTQLLLGLEYALVRPAFLQAAQEPFSDNRFSEVFICLGGADPKNDTLEVAKKCLENPILQAVHLVIGSAYSYIDALQTFVNKQVKPVFIYRNLSDTELVNLMKRCYYHITSPSTIAYESVCVRGELYLYQTADNQAHTLYYLLQERLALAWLGFLAETKNTDLISNQQKAVDGNSPQRLQEIFTSLAPQQHGN